MADGKKSASETKLIAKNRKARHNYEILDTWETGIVLAGTEVKSLRNGGCNLGDGYADVVSGEVFLRNVHISPYEQGNRMNHDPFRPRKLLLHRREIRKLVGLTAQQGFTLVPLSLYFRNGVAKCELALARGKKLHDKREAEATRDAQMKIRQATRGGMRRRSGGDDA
jgi:SsrA-binding protein